MHINKNTSAESLTSAEKVHLKSCPQCSYEHEPLSLLNSSLEQIELLAAPQSDWLVIQQRMANKDKVQIKVKRSSPVQWFISVAASVTFLAVGWLAWSNYHLQGQLEQVLVFNQQLEAQLSLSPSPTFHQVKLLSKVRLLELQLQQTTTPNEKIQLLEQRKKLMTKMVNVKQGAEYEYSI